MSNNENMGIRGLSGFAGFAISQPTYPQPIPEEFALNSPVGISLDHNGNLWLCDAESNRIIIFSHDFCSIVGIITCLIEDRQQDAGGNHQLRMPSHVCRHPEKNWMYVTDRGNGRVVVFDYSESLGALPKNDYAKCVKVFDDEQVIDKITIDNLDAMAANQNDSGTGKKNQYNGIIVIADDEHHCCVYAADEFYQRWHGADRASLNRGRIVRFNEDGKYIAEFHGVQVVDGGKRHDLHWPQSLGTDRSGNLYITNAGCNEAIQCDPKSPIDASFNLQVAVDESNTQLDSLAHAQGNSSLTTMRNVSVVRDKNGNTRGLAIGGGASKMTINAMPHRHTPAWACA